MRWIRSFTILAILLWSATSEAVDFKPSIGSVSGKVSIVGTTGDGSDKVANVNVGNVLNVKSFGAAASIQTMSCTATASSAVLTGCTGGDFKVGDGVRIPLAGSATLTISTPAAPTGAGACTGTSCGTTAITDTAGSMTVGSNVLTTATGGLFPSGLAGREICVGGVGIAGATMCGRVWFFNSATSLTLTFYAQTTVAGTATISLPTHTYNLSVMAVQGYPNGILTPASAASNTVTIPKLYMKAGDVNDEHIAWSGYSVTSGKYYALYESIDGGAYNFYCLEATTTFTDNGVPCNGTFTAAELDLPATVVPGTTPAQSQAIFGQITSINGSSVTIGQERGTPSSVSPFQGAYAFTPAQTGTFTVEHDDTGAFMTAMTQLYAQGRSGAVYIPLGDYNVSAGVATSSGIATVFDLVGLRNVSIYGDPGWSSKLHLKNNRTWTGFAGELFNSLGNGLQYTLTAFSSGTKYNVVDPVLANTGQIQIISPPVAGTFNAGDPIYIAMSPAGTPKWNEYNEVTSYDPATGIIGLRWPTSRWYSAETSPGFYLNCSGGVANCAATPYVVNVRDTSNTAGGITSAHVVVRDLWFDGGMDGEQCQYCFDFHFDHIYGRVIEPGINDNNFRGHYLEHGSRMIVERADGSASGWVSAAGSIDSMMTDSEMDFTAAIGNQSCNEESVNNRTTNDVFRIGGPANGNNASALFALADCNSAEFSGNQIEISGSNLLTGVSMIAGALNNSRIVFDHNIWTSDYVLLGLGRWLTTPNATGRAQMVWSPSNITSFANAYSTTANVTGLVVDGQQYSGNTGSAQVTETITGAQKTVTAFLNNFNITGSAQTFTFPIPFSAAPILTKTCTDTSVTSGNTSTSTVYTLPAGASMSAETCIVTMTGQ